MKKILKIGLFGGSFDPVHNGHIVLAKSALKEFDLDKVVFIPAKLPPHKLNKRLSPETIRLKMLSAALKPYKHFSISRFELNRKPATYTYQTVAHFRKLYPSSPLYFIIGADSLLELTTWKKIGFLLKQVHFIAGNRQGVSVPERTPFFNSVETLKSRIPAVSSTKVRELAFRRKPLKGLVPAAVEKIVNGEGVYDSISDR